MPRKDKITKVDERVKEAYEATFIKLTIAAEYKDHCTGAHIRRVSDYSTAIAKALGLPEEEVQTLRYASMMHDIGKIGIPERILRKKSALTAAESKKMREHALIGSKIASGTESALAKAAGEIALTHHEKFDGSGYPNGLKRNKIPLYGRIVALADYFDAVVSKRKYKNAQNFDKVIVAIEEKSGTFFDPKIVDAFLKVKGTIKEILNANLAIEKFAKEKA